MIFMQSIGLSIHAAVYQLSFHQIPLNIFQLSMVKLLIFFSSSRGPFLRNFSYRLFDALKRFHGKFLITIALTTVLRARFNTFMALKRRKNAKIE